VCDSKSAKEQDAAIIVRLMRRTQGAEIRVRNQQVAAQRHTTNLSQPSQKSPHACERMIVFNERIGLP